MTPEAIERYMRKAQTALDESHLLVEQGYFAGGVSRAYYAVVSASNAALEARGVRVKSHRALLSLFGLHFIKSGLVPAELGATLSRLQAARDERATRFWPRSPRSQPNSRALPTRGLRDANGLLKCRWRGGPIRVRWQLPSRAYSPPRRDSAMRPMRPLKWYPPLPDAEPTIATPV